MAKLGTVEAANRYEAVVVGPRLSTSYEIQDGQPVDGTSALLRDLSPFQIRFVPPDILLDLAGVSLESALLATTSINVDLIAAAARGADTSLNATSLANALSRVSAIQITSTGQFDTAALESLIANGEFLAGQGDESTPTITNIATAADIALQLQTLLSAPPLILLVNPREMSVSYTNLQNYGTRTRYGFVFERWGQEQPGMSLSGTTGAFIAGVTDSANSSSLTGQVSGKNSSVSGVQFAAKRDSAAWQNLMALYTFYRNNGYIFDTLGQSEAHHFIGSIAIDYDQWTYVGHFESFNYSYDEGMPHRIEWSAEFKISRMYDWSSSPSVVLPQTAPTQSLSSSRASGSRSSAQTLATLPQTEVETTEDVGQVPLDLIGGEF